ncbi:MAG TPA: hypothetical protein VKG92_01315 [Flavobacteriales bacterium]|nr:hypothetical protein [Flavobacteriales bacterium]
MNHFATFLFLLVFATTECVAQTLVDSIPYPGISQGFWGIDVCVLFLS